MTVGPRRQTGFQVSPENAWLVRHFAGETRRALPRHNSSTASVRRPTTASGASGSISLKTSMPSTAARQSNLQPEPSPRKSPGLTGRTSVLITRSVSTSSIMTTLILKPSVIVAESDIPGYRFRRVGSVPAWDRFDRLGGVDFRAPKSAEEQLLTTSTTARNSPV